MGPIVFDRRMGRRYTLATARWDAAKYRKREKR